MESQRMLMWCQVFLLLVGLTFWSVQAAETTLQLKILNLSGRPIEVYWINTFQPGSEMVRQTSKALRNNSDHAITTYETHAFNFRFLHHVEGADANYTMGPTDVTVCIKYDEDSNTLRLEAIDAATEMKDLVQASSQRCHELHGGDKDALKTCLVEALMDEVHRVGDSISRLEHYRSKMSDRFRNYTCLDTEVQTSEPLKSFDFFHLDEQYVVDMYLDTANAKIWSIQNFVTEEECDLLVQSSQGRLQAASTVGSDGQAEHSGARRAQQATYDFKKDMRSDKLWPLFDRIIRTINFNGKLNLQPEGQEGLAVIQYGPGDEYLSHCDGNCDGGKFRAASRVATGVVYCRIPEKGGATVFPKANVVVQPKEGMATFFTYKGRNDHYDFKSTEHSGCPVVEGEKWIATAWLREGVSAELTHSEVDPSGNPVDPEDYDDTPQVSATTAVDEYDEEDSVMLEEKSHDEF